MTEALNRLDRGKQCQAGFTLLELTVVVVIVGILFLFAYQRYLDLLVDVERASVEQTLGIIRSAMGMRVAQLLVEGRIDELEDYAGANPIDFLAEVPNSYVGEVADQRNLDDRSGIWYFDKTSGILVYRIKNRNAFFSEVTGLDRARFRLNVVYNDENKKRFAGLSLRPVERYSWFEKRY
jgi:general secretion pathway protein G